MKTSRCLVIVSASWLGLFSISPAQTPTPVVPKATNFNFHRGVLRAFQPGEGLAMVDHRGEARTFRVSPEAVALDHQGKPLKAEDVRPGSHVAVTVVDPRQADAVSTVTKLMVAPARPGPEGLTPVRGLVVRMDDVEDVAILMPDGEGAQEVPVLYNEGDTEFEGGDEKNVGEEQLQAGDRIMVYLAAQEDGGLMAERILFLGDSAESGLDDGLID